MSYAKGVVLLTSFEAYHLPAYLNCNSNVRQNQTLDPCHADGWAAAAELTPLRYVRPSYRLLRPRCRENLYPAGTSHFPRPWAGHVRRAARPFGYFGYTGIGNEKRVVEIFGHPLFVSINQMLFFYAADTVSVRIATIRIHLIAFRCLIAFFELL